jgi:hypothetical protein
MCMYMRPIPNGFRDRAISLYSTVLYTVQTSNTPRHVLTRVAKCIDVDGGIFENALYYAIGACGSVVEALCYKPEGRRFESQMRWNFFNLPYPSSRTMALGSTQPLTEMSIRNLPGGKKRPARRADNLAAICEPNVFKCGSLNLPQP